MEEIPLVSPESARNRERERVFHRRINKHWKAFASIKHKPERIIYCNAQLLFRMCIDVHAATLSQWDPDWKDYDCIEELDENLWVMDDGKALAWYRQGCNGERTTWIIIHALGDSYVAYQIMALDRERCYISTNGSRERLDLIANATRGDSIYRDWPCAHCHKETPARMLVCKSCSQPRYWKCECGVAQLFGTSECRKCGTVLLLNN